jgi:3-deoxy-manno-octulosonate cytidylyltransferase (CMP-KDO synthetase)
MSQILGIIPARWGATRFPGKPLVLIAGKPLVQRVWEQARKARRLDAVLIATEDDRIADAARGFGAEIVITSPDHPSGTDRIAEAAGLYSAERGSISHVINIQGDEPTIDPALIDRLADTLLSDPALEMVTAANPLHEITELQNPNCVKVVLAKSGNALYFSRGPIPCPAASVAGAVPAVTFPYLRHQGIYGYTSRFLAEFVRWQPSPLEQAERLEQLRALENGARIRVVVTPHESLGVDAPEDVARVEAALALQLASTASGADPGAGNLADTAGGFPPTISSSL